MDADAVACRCDSVSSASSAFDTYSEWRNTRRDAFGLRSWSRRVAQAGSGSVGPCGNRASSCSDHNGHHKVYLAEWDGTKWTKASDWIEPMKDRVRPLIEGAAKDYAAANAGWPKRTEACDKAS